jgi:hypothetical protein
LGGFRAVCANNERMGQAYDETRRSRTGAGPRVQCPLPRRDNFCSYRFSARTNVARQCFDMKISTHGSRSERAHSVKPPFEFWSQFLKTFGNDPHLRRHIEMQVLSSSTANVRYMHRDVDFLTVTFWML